MASNHTSRFGLSQWAEDDPVLREDFNRDNALLEETLDKLAIVVGSYTGTITTSNMTQTIELGFVPELLMVFPRWPTAGNVHVTSVAVTPETEWASMENKGQGDGVILNGSSFTVHGSFNYSPTQGSTYSKILNPFRYVAWKKL